MKKFICNLPFPPPIILYQSVVKTWSPASQADSVPSDPPGEPRWRPSLAFKAEEFRLRTEVSATAWAKLFCGSLGNIIHCTLVSLSNFPACSQHWFSKSQIWWVSEWKSLSCVQLFVTPWTIYSPWNSPGQNTGVGSLFLLQGIFPTQGLNPSLPYCRQILYQLSRQSGRTLQTQLLAYF